MKSLYSIVLSAGLLSLGCQRELTTITYNTALLPEIISPLDTEENAPLIAGKLRELSQDPEKDYLVFAQEVFDPGYDQILSENSGFPYHTSRPEKTHALGDGLKMFSDFEITNVVRKPWKHCYGKFSDGSDCLTSKGSIYSVIKLEGIEFIAVDVHFDSGDSLGDIEARNRQIRQFIEEFNIIVKNRAVIVAGDFNTIDNVPLGIMKTWTGLQDVCDVLSCPAETIDRVYFKNNRFVTFTPTSYSVSTELFVSEQGKALSDHLPVAVDWKIEIGPPGISSLAKSSTKNTEDDE